MTRPRTSLGIMAGAALFVIAGLIAFRPGSPLIAQPGGQQPPSVEDRLSAWSQERGDARIPAAVSFGARLPDAQVEQVARRYGVLPYAVFMWSDGMSGAHRVENSDASLGVIAEARSATVAMKQKARESNRFRSQRFVDENPEERVASDQALAQRAKFLLSAAEQNERILTAARNGAPLIFALEVLGTPEQIRRLAQDPAVAAVEPAVIVDGRVTVPTPPPPAETRNRFESAGIEGLGAAEAYNRVRRQAGLQ